MRLTSRLLNFARDFPLSGPLFWLIGIQYFILQTIVSLAAKNYSWQNNSLSDLGVTTCGNFRGEYICSPLHALMDLSFVVLGASTIAGSLLTFYIFRKNINFKTSITLMIIAGAGILVAGLVPENVSLMLHIVGAGTALSAGNLSLIAFGKTPNVPKFFRLYGLLFGIISLIAAILFVTDRHFLIGSGLMERIAAYPQTVWLILFGAFIIYHRRQA